jgi:hypothetical protein
VPAVSFSLVVQRGRRAIYSPSQNLTVGEVTSSASVEEDGTGPGTGPSGAGAGPTRPHAGPSGWHRNVRRAMTGTGPGLAVSAPGCHRNTGRSAAGQPVHRSAQPGLRSDQAGPDRAVRWASAGRRGKLHWMVLGVHRSRGRLEPGHPVGRPVTPGEVPGQQENMLYKNCDNFCIDMKPILLEIWRLLIGYF